MRWSEEEYEEYKKNKQLGVIQNISKKKQNKYRNHKTTIDGITFDSKKEAEYYCQLKLLKKAGEIKDFGMQQRYELQPEFNKNGKKYQSITYVADFVIVNNDGTTEVIDVKGFETKEFKIKKKLFEYKYPDLSLKVVK